MRLSTNTIKCAAMAIAALALTLGESGQAKAAFIPVGGTPVTGETSLSGGPAGPDPIFVFNFTDVSGDVGHATLNTVASGLGDGSYFVTSGSLTMTGPAGVAGTYSLITTPPSPTISPSGLFDVDNLLYPDDNAASLEHTIPSRPTMPEAAPFLARPTSTSSGCFLGNREGAG